MFELKIDTHVSPVAETFTFGFLHFFGFQVTSFCRTDGRTKRQTGKLTKPVMRLLKQPHIGLTK